MILRENVLIFGLEPINSVKQISGTVSKWVRQSLFICYKSRLDQRFARRFSKSCSSKAFSNLENHSKSHSTL